ncbi:phosphatase PAP2 family protein, partial (plasmid) [Clostridium perfringens]
TAINAVLVGYIIFWDELTNITFRIMDRVKETEPYIIFIVLAIVCIVVVAAKAYFGEGTPLKGGMPSGHSAIAFSIATAISLISNSHIIIILSYLMALITAQSRVDSEVHSVWEVIAGAILGTLITILIFKIFS